MDARIAVVPTVEADAAVLHTIYMTNTTIQAGSAPAPKSLASRFIGILTAPGETYRSVVAHPKWLGMLVLTTLIMAVCTSLPMMTEEGQQAAVDAQVRQMESMGRQVNDQMYEGLQRSRGFMPYMTAGGVVVMGPLMAAIMAGILFAIFNAGMGGEASYKQVFTVLVHASVISAAGQLFTGPLNYFRGQVTSATNLAVMLPMLEEGSFFARLAGMIDLFVIWWLVVLSIGLAVLYRRRTQPIAITLFAIYAVIALGFSAFMSGMGGGN